MASVLQTHDWLHGTVGLQGSSCGTQNHSEGAGSIAGAALPQLRGKGWAGERCGDKPAASRCQ